jgi:tetratricopeptide (TPR) repeat protein
MKLRKEGVIAILLMVVILGGAVFLLNYLRNRERNALATRIAALEGRSGVPTGIEDLKSAIALYEQRIENHVQDAAQTGIYWKILANRLQDKGLYNEALNALERAIYYNPADPALQYLVGISASMAAKGSLDFNTGSRSGDRYFGIAESAYLNSISLDETYARSRYALGVLYVFELDRPEEAIPHLEKYLDLTVNDTDGMFVLARAYFMTSRYEEALNVYDRILSISKDQKIRREAEENRRYVMDVYYG